MQTHLFSELSRKLTTPEKVQTYLHNFEYNRGATMYSALTAIKNKKAHCLEGVFVAAAILEYHNYEPLVLSLESQDQLDHCLFIYQQKGRWGSIGKSRDQGLCGRIPRFKSLRNLVWSYFDPYVDKTGKITAWQVAHLDEIDCNWRTSTQNVWAMENHLLEIKHNKLKSSMKRYKKNLHRYWAKGDLPLNKCWR